MMRRNGGTWLAVAMVVLCASGFTTVRLYTAEGAVSVERHFGFASITAGPSVDSVVAELRSFGYSSSPVGVAFGYTRQSMALLPEGCRLVVWMESREEVDYLKSLIPADADVCTIVDERPLDAVAMDRTTPTNKG